MNILVTGGLGYIGSQVSRDLIKKGHNVIIIDNIENSYIENKPKNSIFFKGNFSNNKILKKIFLKYKIEAAYHFAASISVEESVKKPEKYFKNNYIRSKKFIDFCVKSKIKYFIFSSTAAVYYNGNKKCREDCKTQPKSPYGKSKLLTEKYIKKIKEKTKFSILRYFNVAGAASDLKNGQNSKRKSNHLIKKITDAIIFSETFSIYGRNYKTKDGTAIRDFIHIEDISDIHIKILKYLKLPKSPLISVFNCGYGKGITVLDVVKCAQKISNFKYKFKKERIGDIPCVVACTNKLKSKLNWKPKHNSLKKIILSSIQWKKKIMTR